MLRPLYLTATTTGIPLTSAQVACTKTEDLAAMAPEVIHQLEAEAGRLSRGIGGVHVPASVADLLALAGKIRAARPSQLTLPLAA